MKIFEKNSTFYILVVLLAGLILASFCILPKVNVSYSEIWLLTVSSLFTLIITLMSVAIPLVRSLAQKKQEDENELKLIYLNTIILLGSELLTNLDTLEQLKEGMNKEYPSIIKDLSDKEKLQQHMGIVQATAKVLQQNLTDRVYIASISNGSLLKTQPEDLNDLLQKAYKDMELCKMKLSNISEFFDMILNPKPGEIVQTVADKMMEERVPTAIDNANKEFDIALESVNACIKKLQEIADRYDKKYEIIKTEIPLKDED